MDAIASHNARLEASIHEKTLSTMLEKNLMILEEDFNLMVFKIQSGMSKLTNNNLALSEIYQEGVSQWCESIENASQSFRALISNCESMEDQFQALEILAMKISLFKQMVEQIAKGGSK